MRITDLVLTLPALAILLTAAALFGSGSQWRITFILAGFFWTGIARISRGVYLSLREKEYVEAAKASGAGDLRIMFRHILPNTLGPVIVNGTLSVAAAIITEAALSFLGYAMPVFWLALLLQILFVDIYLKWNVRIFYTSGLNAHGNSTWSLDRLQHIGLPVVTLTVVSFALYSRYMRASMLDSINTDYVRTARAKGLSERHVIMRHVFRNALIPIVTVAALNLGALLGGAIITETVFSLDGIGFYFITKLGQLDVYAVMAYLAVTSVIVIVFNLIADILYGYLDPRIRYD